MRLRTRGALVALLTIAITSGCVYRPLPGTGPGPGPAPIPQKPLPIPLPVVLHVENVGVRSGEGPINNATVKVVADGGGTLTALRDAENAGRYQFLVPSSFTGGGWLFAWAEGYKEFTSRVIFLREAGEVLGVCYDCPPEEAKPLDILMTVLIKRPPMDSLPPLNLGELPTGGGDYNRDFYKVWPEPPAREGCNFIRADLWGVEMGVPKVPGGSSYGRVLSWILPRYGPQWFEPIMFEHAKRGYTHFYLSWQDSNAPIGAEGRPVPPGDNMSLDQFVAMAKRIKHDYGFCVEVFLLSKYFSPHHAPAQTYIDMVAPVMDALIAADAVDGFVTCWECNAFMLPGRPVIDYFKWVGERAHRAGKKASMHWLTHYTNWHADGDPRGRFGFFDDVRCCIDYLLYQSDQEWSGEDYQGRLADTLKQNRVQPWIKMVAFEDGAYKKWGNERPNEYDSHMRCIVAMATNEPVRLSGYGEGCRWPDGRPF